MTEEQARSHAEALTISRALPSMSYATAKEISWRCKRRRTTAKLSRRLLHPADAIISWNSAEPGDRRYFGRCDWLAGSISQQRSTCRRQSAQDDRRVP